MWGHCYLNDIGKNFAVQQVLRACIREAQSIFISCYVRYITHRSVNIFYLGLVMAAHQINSRREAVIPVKIFLSFSQCVAVVGLARHDVTLLSSIFSFTHLETRVPETTQN